jgi:hypothetical protein
MLARSTHMTRRKAVNKRGPRTKAWTNARRQLKREFAAMGIQSCELQYGGCWGDDTLGFAHAAKRRKLKPEDLKTVILACANCHDLIEFLPADEMKAVVERTIRLRNYF